MQTRENSLFRNPDPLVRATFRGHLWLFILWAPSNALLQYAPFLAVKTFNAPHWAPTLTAIIPAAHLMGVFFNRAISRSSKTAWVVWPMAISNAIFLVFFFVDRRMGWLFAVVIILAQLLRAPIISAQSAIFRTNYPPTLRSSALALPMAMQVLVIALFAWGAGMAFDLSEDYIIPYFLLAAFVGIVAALAFKHVRPRTDAEPPYAEDGRSYIGGIVEQFRSLARNPAFFRYQLSYMFFGAGSVAVTAILPFYLDQEFHANHRQATAAINVVQNLAFAATLPLWGFMLDRHNPLVLRAVTTAVWAIQPILLLFAGSMKSVYAAQIIVGVVNSGGTLIWWLGVNYFAKSHEVANLMTMHQTLTGVRGVFAPYLGIEIGHLFGYRRSMIFWFVMMAIGFAIMVDEVLRERKGGRLKSFSEAESALDTRAEGPTIRIAASSLTPPKKRDEPKA